MTTFYAARDGLVTMRVFELDEDNKSTNDTIAACENADYIDDASVKMVGMVLGTSPPLFMRPGDVVLTSGDGHHAVVTAQEFIDKFVAVVFPMKHIESISTLGVDPAYDSRDPNPGTAELGDSLETHEPGTVEPKSGMPA